MGQDTVEREARHLLPKAGNEAKITINAAGVNTDLTTLGTAPTGVTPSPTFASVANGNFIDFISDQDFFLECADANQAISANAPPFKAGILYSGIPSGHWLLVKRVSADGTLYVWTSS